MMQMMDTKLKQVDVLPMVKHYITELGLHDILDKYVPNDNGCEIKREHYQFVNDFLMH